MCCRSASGARPNPERAILAQDREGFRHSLETITECERAAAPAGILKCAQLLLKQQRSPRIFWGSQPTEEPASFTDEAVARRAPSANDHNQRILQFALAHPRLLGALDVALALTEPGSDLRRRLLLMAAVIETQPRYAERFLSCDRSKLYPLVLLLVGLRAAARAAVGLLLLRFVG